MPKTKEKPKEKLPLREPEARLDKGVLQRSFNLLGVLLEASQPLSLRELAEAVQLHDSTVYRLLQVLCDMGYVSRSGSRRYYATGKVFLPLAVYHPFNVLRRDAYNSLCALRDQYGLTASLLVFIGTARSLIDVAGSPGVLAPYYETHLTNPLHASAAGKLILQRMSLEERRSILGPAPYAVFTPHTRTTEELLRADLELGASRGFTTSIDENFIGLSAMATPIFAGPEQVVGALALVGPTSKFTDKNIQEMGLDLRNRAQLISVGSQAVRSIRGMFAAQVDSR